MRLSLRVQIILALAMLALLFVAALGMQVRGFEQSMADHRLLGHTRTLEARIQDVERRGRGYAAVAPRDYESYARDVAVIYSAWGQDLEALDASMADVQSETIRSDAALVAEARSLQGKYAAFRRDLSEKLGASTTEPRLEWGAQLIADRAPLLLRDAQTFRESVSTMVDGHLDAARRLTRTTWIVGALALLVIGLWFWLRVIGRIGRVARACTEVAEGAFGVRAPVESDDELGDLSRAFNQLSSRTRVVLGVLDRLPDGASAAQAFDLLWEESRDYLGHRWQAMLALDPASHDASLLLQHQADGIDFSGAGTRFSLAAIVRQMGLDQVDTAFWPDVRRHTMDQGEGRLLRELSRRDLRTLAMVRIRDPKTQQDRILAFAWSAAAAEEGGVARFLGSLARFFERALLQRAQPVSM
jgi:HAMP domain-containing protein